MKSSSSKHTQLFPMGNLPCVDTKGLCSFFLFFLLSLFPVPVDLTTKDVMKALLLFEAQGEDTRTLGTFVWSWHMCAAADVEPLALFVFFFLTLRTRAHLLNTRFSVPFLRLSCFSVYLALHFFNFFSSFLLHVFSNFTCSLSLSHTYEMFDQFLLFYK